MNSPSDFTHYDFRAVRGYELQVAEFDCLARQPRLPLRYQSENDSECCDYSRRDGSQIVASIMDKQAKIREERDYAVDGAIIVCGVVLAVALGAWIVTTTPGRTDSIDPNKQHDKQRVSD